MKITSYKFCILLIFLSRLSYSQSSENNITLINVGYHDKDTIAKVIETINQLSPAVISLDLSLSEYKNSQSDRKLYEALRGVKKLVLPSIISSMGEDYYGKEMIMVSQAGAPEFYVFSARLGFVSMLAGKDPIKIPTQFIVWQEGVSKDIYKHFSVVTAMAFDSLKTVKYIRNHKRLVDVDYTRRRTFNIFSAKDIVEGKLTDKDFRDKIVMIGFLGPGNDDKFISPFNKRSKELDMYGIEYLAYILAQILESK